MIVVILAFVFSFLISLMLVPALAKLARRTGLVDHPDNKRKLHAESIPMVGGIALFISVLVTASAAIYFGKTYQPFLLSLETSWLGWMTPDASPWVVKFQPDGLRNLLGLLVGSTILVGVGILDDRYGIRGRQKLIGQFIATTALIIGGFHFDRVVVMGFEIEFGVFSVLFVYAWVIAAINSVNLLDGADGIASTIGIVMSLALTVMAITINPAQIVNAILAVTVAGALLGFLRYNFPPAKVYLGDTGSMLIGFVLGALAILCSFKQNYTYAFFAPIALLAIPFIDTAAAIIRRRLTGRSIFAVDRGHLHHSLMKRGYSPTISLLWVFLLCSTTAAGGVLSLINHESNYAMVSIVIVVFVMVGCKIFGVAEFQLVSRKAGSLAKSVFHLTSKTKPDVALSSVHVQGSRDWHEEWTMLCEFADRHGIIEVTLDVNAPWMHESFHATRKRANVPRGGNHEWYSEIPLIAAGRVFGRVEIVDNADNERPHHLIIKEALKVISEIEALLVKPDFNLVHGSGEPTDDPPDSQRPAPSLTQQKCPKDTESPGKTASTSPGSMEPEKWGAKNG